MITEANKILAKGKSRLSDLTWGMAEDSESNQMLRQVNSGEPGFRFLSQSGNTTQT